MQAQSYQQDFSPDPAPALLDPERKVPPSGHHIICEFAGCDSQQLSDMPFLAALLDRAVRVTGATPIGILSHQFDDGGVTVVIGLQESHASIHTWPAEQYAAFDVYTCGDNMNPEPALIEFKASLHPTQTKVMRMKRGLNEMTRDWIYDEGLPYFSNAIRAEFLGEKIFEMQSPYQLIEVYDTEVLGRILRLDRIIQTSEKYGFIYDEALGALPALLRPAAARAFIIGGGDMGTLRTLLQVRSMEQVIMAEIDEAVTEVSKQFLPSIPAGCFDDPRAEIIFEDAQQRLADYEGVFDLVASDLTDPVEGGPAEALFQPDFFRLVKRALRPDGIFATQSGLLYFQSEEVKTVVRNLRQVFDHVQILGVSVPNYGVGPFTFIYASAQPFDVSLDDLRQRFAQNLTAPLRYFTPEVYFYGKSLPPFTVEMLGL
jgi:spermidine synthase